MKSKEGDVWYHTVTEMYVTVFLVQPAKLWYKEKQSGSISTIDTENIDYWEKL